MFSDNANIITQFSRLSCSSGSAQANRALTCDLPFACVDAEVEIDGAKELAVLMRILEQRLALYRKDPDAARAVLAVGESETAGSEVADLAAWATVGRVILNSSEFVTKP